MKTLISLLIISLSSPALAEVKYLPKGGTAPYEGYLFSPEDEEKARMAVKESEYYKKVNDINEKLLDTSVKRIEVKDRHIERLSNELVRRERADFWENALYFTLGAVIVGGVSYGVYRSAVSR